MPPLTPPLYLSSLSVPTVAECRAQCEAQKSCRLFTFSPATASCALANDQARVRANQGTVVGAVADVCQDFIDPPVEDAVKKEPKFDETEINGKFKIMSTFKPSLSDPESNEFKELANTIEESLTQMLKSEGELAEQVEEFTVEVQRFTKGSVVCDFKVNYILKEAYIAIPFAIKPSNITDIMGQNFKFKKGILFQRFLIAAGSFNASSPVDHCASRGCSHKCDYSYELSDYVCTCPPALTLDTEGKRCLGEAEAEVTIKLLPMDCLWSPWSDWGDCSSTCGEGERVR